jgi:hypothetical protein
MQARVVWYDEVGTPPQHNNLTREIDELGNRGKR